MGTAVVNRKKPARDDEIYEGGDPNADTTAVQGDEKMPLNTAANSS